MKERKYTKVYTELAIYFALLLGLFLISNTVWAGDQSLGGVASQVRSSMGDVAALLTAMAYVAGIGFAMMGLFKLKAHKDNPTQVPLGQPLTLLVISAGLVFLPSLIKTAGTTIWGDSKIATGTTGGTHNNAEFIQSNPTP